MNSTRQLNNLADDPIFADLQTPHRNRQSKAPGACATGIEVQHIANPLVTGFVGVASNHHAVAALRIEVEGFDIVEHVNGLAEKLQISSIGKLGCTAGFIDITADGNDRRQRGRIHHTGGTHVP